MYLLIYYCTDLFYHDDLENNCVLPKCLIEFCLIILLDLGLLLVFSSLNGQERTFVCFWVLTTTIYMGTILFFRN